MTENPENDNSSDRADNRNDFFCAFNAFPASSPFIPNKKDNIGECFLFFNCKPPIFRMDSSGVILLSFLAGIHAENNTVITDDKIVTANRIGWYEKTASWRPATFPAKMLVTAIKP